MANSFAERLAEFHDASCGEFLHPWAPDSCSEGTWLLWKGTLERSLPLYAAVHAAGMAPRLLQCRSVSSAVAVLVDAGLGVGRSAAFLSCAAATLVAAACVFRAMAGHSRVLLSGAVPGMMATWALHLEQPHRRRELAGYVFNQAVRILWRRGEAGGLLPAVPRGDLVLFCLALALAAPLRSRGLEVHKDRVSAGATEPVIAKNGTEERVAFVNQTGDEDPVTGSSADNGRLGVATTSATSENTVSSGAKVRPAMRRGKRRGLRGQMRTLMNVLLPPDEEGPRPESAATTDIGVGRSHPPKQAPTSAYVLAMAWQQLSKSGGAAGQRVRGATAAVERVLQTTQKAMPAELRQSLQAKTACCCHENGCAHQVFVAGAHGAGVGLALGLARQGLAIAQGQQARPAILPGVLMLSGLPASFRAVRCVARALGVAREVADALAGLVSGLTLAKFRSMGLAVYFFGKAAEAWYFELAASGKAPLLPRGEYALFGVGAAVILHYAVFEPHILPPSYRKFLDRATKGRLTQINPRRLPYGAPVSM